MPAKKFLRNVLGRITEIYGVVVSAGAANDGDIPALDGTGRLDLSVMPSGIGADIVSAIASEALAAGDWVNLYNNAGVLTVRKADATTNGKPAMGYVLAAVLITGTAQVYLGGVNTQVSGKTNGQTQFLSTTPGASTTTAPTAAGNLVQTLGFATSATSIKSEFDEITTVV